MACVVDEVLGEQEIVVRSLGRRLRRVRRVAGAAILPDGRIALILAAAELVRARLETAGRRRAPAVPPGSGQAARKRVLLVEDSVTTRMLMRNILEAAGYAVEAASDGLQAWQILEDTGADLVVSDVDMPRMDGFALTETIRQSSRFRDLPVVLVTARDSDADRLRGMQAGANAYLVKTAFDQRNLIEAVAQNL